MSNYLKKEKQPWGSTQVNGFNIYAIGDAGDWLLTFDEVTNKQEFIAACVQYEKDVESYDSFEVAEVVYDENDVSIVAVAIIDDPHYDEWRVDWNEDTPNKNVLATLLTRW